MNGHLNGHGKIPYSHWKAERAKLTAERNKLDKRYVTLKDEVKEAEKIRSSVYNILRREQQPRRAQDMEL